MGAKKDIELLEKIKLHIMTSWARTKIYTSYEEGQQDAYQSILEYIDSLMKEKEGKKWERFSK